MMMPLMQTVLLLVYPREQRGFAMGLVGLVINVAPAIGPVISGLLVDSFSWRAVFYVTLPAVLLLMGFIYRYMENVTEQRPAKIDVLSVLLSSVAFGGILYGFNSTGSSTAAMLMIGIGSVALLLFIFRQLRLEKPMLELRTFKRPLFALVIVITALSFSLLIAVETILPMFVQNVQLYSAFDSGLIIFPGAMTLAVMSSWPANGLIGTAGYGSPHRLRFAQLDDAHVLRRVVNRHGNPCHCRTFHVLYGRHCDD